jgi:hypothetical protein
VIFLVRVDLVGSEFTKPVEAKSSEFQPKLKYCAKCNTGIYSAYEGQYVSCKCGAISVDQTKHYMRLIGNPEDFLDAPRN